MAAVSLKYQALRSRFDSLVGAIKSDIGKVARKMFEKELISSDNRRAAENGMINIEDRATKLLDLVLLKVEENEIHYDVFVAILEDIPVLKSQANQLKQAICLHGAIGQRRENYERFPYLDLGRLTEPELKHFTDRLVEDTYNIMTKFGNLVGSVFDSLTKKQISAEQLGTFICTSWSKPYPLPRDHVSQFRCAKHIFDIQYLLVFEYNYISFIKFEILQSIIETYRLPEDKMTTYLSEFSSFCRRSVFEVPSDVIQKISPSSDAKFTVKVSNTYFGETTGEGKRFTMQDLIDVQRDIEKIIGHRFVYVNDIKKGCIEITFSSHVSMLQPLKQLEQLFSKNGLTVIKASTKIKEKAGPLKGFDEMSVIIAKSITISQTQSWTDVTEFEDAPPDIMTAAYLAEHYVKSYWKEVPRYILKAYKKVPKEKGYAVDFFLKFDVGSTRGSANRCVFVKLFVDHCGAADNVEMAEFDFSAAGHG